MISINMWLSFFFFQNLVLEIVIIYSRRQLANAEENKIWIPMFFIIHGEALPPYTKPTSTVKYHHNNNIISIQNTPYLAHDGNILGLLLAQNDQLSAKPSTPLDNHGNSTAIHRHQGPVSI